MSAWAITTAHACNGVIALHGPASHNTAPKLPPVGKAQLGSCWSQSPASIYPTIPPGEVLQWQIISLTCFRLTPVLRLRTFRKAILILIYIVIHSAAHGEQWAICLPNSCNIWREVVRQELRCCVVTESQAEQERGSKRLKVKDFQHLENAEIFAVAEITICSHFCSSLWRKAWLESLEGCYIAGRAESLEPNLEDDACGERNWDPMSKSQKLLFFYIHLPWRNKVCNHNWAKALLSIY